MANGRPEFLSKILESSQVKDKIGEIEKVEEIKEGLNSIFVVEACERYVLKVHTNPRNEVEWFRAEPLIYSRLEDADIPSPKVVFSDLSAEHYENAFFIMEEMPGENPAGFKKQISFENLKEMVQSFGFFLGRIHEEVKMESYGMLGGFEGKLRTIEDPDKWTWAVKGAMDELENLIEDGWEEELELEVPSEREIYEVLPKRPESVLLHLDNRLDNLLIEDGDITAFLDWSHPEAGHYEYDLVRAEYLLIEMDLDFLEREKQEELKDLLYEGYTQVRPLEQDGFEERRDIYRRITLMWVLAGFPNWKSNLAKDERESKKKYLKEKAGREL